MDIEILKIAENTNHNKILKYHTHFLKLKNSLCGDEIQISLIIKNDKIINFGYEGKCCIYCQASASLLSEVSINQKKNKIDELCNNANLFFKDNKGLVGKKLGKFKKLFKKENFPRKDCILLPFKTFKKIKKNSFK
tara:strand:+ start:269 stop:676 length:408 start_codon:yes stop_codon:yes gene_type:complete